MKLGRTLSLRTQLLLSFALVAIVSIAAVSAVLTGAAERRMGDGLHAKSIHYARLLQAQLAPVVAFDDVATGREVLDSLGADDDVEGLAVYDGEGALIVGRGTHPARMTRDLAMDPSDERFVALAPISSREGPSGAVFVALSTKQIRGEQRRAVVLTVGAAAVALLLSLLLAHNVTRRLVARVDELSASAARIAAGDFRRPKRTMPPSTELGRLERALGSMAAELERLFEERSRAAATEQERLEGLVAKRTRELEESREHYRLIAETTNAIPFALSLEDYSFPYVGPQAATRLGFTEVDWKEPGALERLAPRDKAVAFREELDRCTSGSFDAESEVITSDGRAFDMRWIASCSCEEDGRILRGLLLDVTEQRRLERELAQAQKLESVGRLASGVAHEINTPVQFVSDSVRFVREGLGDLERCIAKWRSLRDVAANDVTLAPLATEVSELEDDLDIAYTLEQAPRALDRALDGLERVAVIVRSMKEFAYPDRKEKSHVDLNRAIESTLVIAANEYKYVADVRTELGEVPPVLCHGGEINQVILNLVVNAAHAIGSVVKGTDRRGSIVVSTKQVGSNVEIAVRDTGSGMPPAVANKIFEPFFTTKEPGKGTGQGLAMARSVVGRHGGSIRFETEPGAGTAFFVTLPIDGAAATAREAAE